MTVLVTGSSGLVGSALMFRTSKPAATASCTAGSRRRPKNDLGSAGGIRKRENSTPPDLEGVQAVVHLAGEKHRLGPVERRKERQDPQQSGRWHTASGARPCGPSDASRRADLRIGRRLLRQPRRRDPQRGERAGRRLPGGDTASPGSMPRGPRRTRASVRCTCASESCSAPTAARWPKCCSRSKWAQAA